MTTDPEPVRWWQPIVAALALALVALVVHRIGRLPLQRGVGHTVVPRRFVSQVDRPSRITDTSERCMQLRVLVSSASSGENWDLRGKLREGLIDFIGREHPHALPRLRAEIATAPGPGSAGSAGPGPT